MFNKHYSTHTHHHTRNHNSDLNDVEKRILVLEKDFEENKNFYWWCVGVAAFFIIFGYALICKRTYFPNYVFWAVVVPTSFQIALLFATRVKGRCAITLSILAIFGSAIALAYSVAFSEPGKFDSSWINCLCFG